MKAQDQRTPLQRLSDFFGSKILARYLKQGRQREAFLASVGRRVYFRPVWTRRDGSQVKDGTQPIPEPPHKDAIAVLRCGLLAPPHVKTEELMASYRKLKNKLKTIRRLTRG